VCFLATCGALPGDKGKPEKLKTHGAWWKNVISPIRKDLVEALESIWRLAVRSVLLGDNYRHGHQRRVCVWRYVSPARRSKNGQHLAVCVPRQVILLLQLWVAGSAGVIYKAFSDASKVGLLVFLDLSSERIP